MYIGTWIRVRKSDTETAGKKMKKSFLAMFLLYAFMRGVCDIDDLILNVGGVGFAYLILHIKPVRKFTDKITFGLYY